MRKRVAPKITRPQESINTKKRMKKLRKIIPDNQFDIESSTTVGTINIKSHDDKIEGIYTNLSQLSTQLDELFYNGKPILFYGVNCSDGLEQKRLDAIRNLFEFLKSVPDDVRPFYNFYLSLFYKLVLDSNKEIRKTTHKTLILLLKKISSINNTTICSDSSSQFQYHQPDKIWSILRNALTNVSTAIRTEAVDTLHYLVTTIKLPVTSFYFITDIFPLLPLIARQQLAHSHTLPGKNKNDTAFSLINKCIKIFSKTVEASLDTKAEENLIDLKWTEFSAIMENLRNDYSKSTFMQPREQAPAEPNLDSFDSHSSLQTNTIHRCFGLLSELFLHLRSSSQNDHENSMILVTSSLVVLKIFFCFVHALLNNNSERVINIGPELTYTHCFDLILLTSNDVQLNFKAYFKQKFLNDMLFLIQHIVTFDYCSDISAALSHVVYHYIILYYHIDKESFDKYAPKRVYNELCNLDKKNKSSESFLRKLISLEQFLHTVSSDLKNQTIKPIKLTAMFNFSNLKRERTSESDSQLDDQVLTNSRIKSPENPNPQLQNNPFFALFSDEE